LSERRTRRKFLTPQPAIRLLPYSWASQRAKRTSISRRSTLLGDVFLAALRGSKQSEDFCIFSPFRLFSGNLDRLLGVKLKVGQDVGYHLPMFSFAALRNFGPIHRRISECPSVSIAPSGCSLSPECRSSTQEIVPAKNRMLQLKIYAIPLRHTNHHSRYRG